MKILVSNDDGIHAEGIRVLAQRLAQDRTHEVYVVAPEEERSATGHSLTLHKPLRADKVAAPGNVKEAWKTTGTPSDCVKLAVLDLLPAPPDVVVSGVNNGSNLGGEVLSSGTVAAAMEGSFLSIPSIAVSQLNEEDSMSMYYDTAAEVIARLLNILQQTAALTRCLLNINVPNLPFSQLAGVAITELGVRMYDDRFEKRADPRGRAYYWLAGQPLPDESVENTDTWAVVQKMVSITPISFNMTDRKMMERLSLVQELKNLVSGL